MGYSNGRGVTQLPRIRSWADAKWFFENRPPAKSEAYGPMERPLHPRPHADVHQYRLVKLFDGGYEVLLYRTPMARFEPPDAQGHRRVCYSTDRRMLSTRFMWHVLGVSQCWSMRDTEGDFVWVPMQYSIPHSSFAAELTLDSEGRLIKELSRHAPLGAERFTDEQKEYRKQLRGAFKNLLDMIPMKLGEEVSRRVVEGVHIDYALKRIASGVTTAEDIDTFFTWCASDDVRGGTRYAWGRCVWDGYQVSLQTVRRRILERIYSNHQLNGHLLTTPCLFIPVPAFPKVGDVSMAHINKLVVRGFRHETHGVAT